MRWMRLRVIEWRPAVAAGALAGVGTALCLLLLGSGLRSISGTEVVAVAITHGALLFGLIIVGGCRRVVWLWVALVVLWVIALHNTLNAARWSAIETIKALPESFTAWSVIALPLSAATALFLSSRAADAGGRRATSAAIIVWLGLLLFSSYLVGFAPDVGRNPRHSPVAMVLTGILLPPLPFVVSWWAIRQVKRANETSGA